MSPIMLLTSDEMRAAEARAIEAGTPVATLMQRAGEGVASIIQSLYSQGRYVVVCGSGNNGGDGRIAAQILQRAGATIIYVTPQEDVASALIGADVIIDAMLGTGLNKQVTGDYAKAIEAINAATCPVIAVDIASGINATTGEVMGVAVRATHTITFAGEKRGHYLLPGKAHTGTLHLVDIGVRVQEAGAALNSRASWKLPEPTFFSHKYSRGSALVMGGNIASSGAAKLVANAALKIGAGAVSVICDRETLPVYAASLTAVMTKIADTADEFYRLVNEPRVSALAIGPGAGVSEETRQRTFAMLETGKTCVIDADALQPEMLEAAHAHTIITPHAGEFGRLFGAHANKIAAVEFALTQFPGVLVYKGSDTVIAQRGKALVINGNAPPTLATAGSGDVLAGLIAGLAAQAMDAFDAACAGVWLHGKLGGMLGRFYSAEDMVQAISALKL